MKKSARFILLLLFAFSCGIYAQDPVFIPENDSLRNVIDLPPQKPVMPKIRQDSLASEMYGWRIDPRSAERIITDVKKTVTNFHQTTLTDGQGIAIGYLGNIGSPSQSKLFFEREESSLFPFLDGFVYSYVKPEDLAFINTKIPYSNIFYQSGGGRMDKEERFKAEMSINFGKKLNIGFNIDYLYARGFYANLYNKQFNYNIYASYISDRYQMHAYVANNYFNNSENGGINNDLYITNPDRMSDQEARNFTSKDILVNLEGFGNKLRGRQIFVSNKYNVGYEKGEDGREFVPVASFILTSRYADQRRTVLSKNDITVVYDGEEMMATDTLFANNYYRRTSQGATGGISLPVSPINDFMSYWTFKNTFAVSLNEGFKDWVKFGLTAFIEQDFRKFALPQTEAGIVGITEVASQNSTVIGGMLTKQKGRLLKYNLQAEIGIIGANIGEFKIIGDLSTSINFAGKDAILRAKGYIKNITPTFFQEKFRSKYVQWDDGWNPSDTRRVFVGGEIIIPQTNTVISGGVENIQNYIYLKDDNSGISTRRNINIKQSDKNIQVVSLRLDQKLNTGIFHWDNQIAYQTSSDKDVIPLPQLSFYSNIYILTKIAKVLTVQLGVDAHFHTKYYAATYDPVTMQFYNQQETKIGGFPISTAYVNLDLKKTRFFIMMYNVAKDLGNSNYFSLPHYPVNPMIMKFGLSWDFSN